MARLLRAMPELMILIKGMLAASRVLTAQVRGVHPALAPYPHVCVCHCNDSAPGGVGQCRAADYHLTLHAHWNR
eukprot:3183123-Amphidinium_carterae.1